MSPLVFVLLLEGKANLKGCDTLELPSSDAMNQASPDVIDRLHAIKEVDLRKDKIGFYVAGKGRQCVRGASGSSSKLVLLQGNTAGSRNLLRGPYGAPLFPPHLPVPPGDIAALQNMPLESLDLSGCEKLTGKPAVRVGRISKVLPQGNT